jgi:hypothetical protein
MRSGVSELTQTGRSAVKNVFCRAWQRDAKEDLLARRDALKGKLEPRDDIGVRVMAQINRTQSQEGVRDIRSMYLQAVNNATKFIYIEKPVLLLAGPCGKNQEFGEDPG